MPGGEAAWQEFRARLLSFVGRRVADGQAAEDIVQEIMLRIHRHSSSLGHPGAMSAWIYQIARNAIIDYYRGAAARRELPAGIGPGDDLAAAAQQDDDSELRGELATCLAPLLGRLSAADQEAIRLTEFEGLTQAAAASRLGLSVSGLKSRVRRARARLRQQLTDCCQIEQERRGAVISYQPRHGACDCGTSAAPARSAGQPG